MDVVYEDEKVRTYDWEKWNRQLISRKYQIIGCFIMDIPMIAIR